MARPQHRDAALRIMAWNSVISLPPDEREALDLVTRHGMTPPEVALVLGLPESEAPALIATARQHLEQALAAEILINRESQECAGRSDALRGWTGTVTPAVRERLLRHAGSCSACAPRLPRNVSMAKIFGLLPRPVLTEGVDDADGRRTENIGPPAPLYLRTGPARAWDAGRLRGRRVYAGIGAAFAAVGVAAVLAAGSLGGHTPLSGSSRNLPAAADAPAQAGVGRPIPQPDSGPPPPGASPRHAGTSSLTVSTDGGTASGHPGSPAPTTALATPSAGPPTHAPKRASKITLLPGPAPSGAGPQSPGTSAAASPAPAGELEISPTSLDLGAGSYGQVVLTASGGPVGWTASMSSANLTLSQSSGQLSAGQSVTLVVNVRRQGGAAGSATITIGAASASSTVPVQVTWAAHNSPSPSPPSRNRPPSPSPAAS